MSVPVKRCCLIAVVLGGLLCGCNKKPVPTVVDPPGWKDPIPADLKFSEANIPTTSEKLAAYIKDLQTPNPGKGIFVFSPVVQEAGISADFATSCARWLFLVVGGAPEMTQTPVWNSGHELQQNLGRTDLRLTNQEAAKAAKSLGAPYYATGKITKTGISFQLYDDKNATVGEPIVLAGTEEQIKAQLPEAAKTMLARLDLPAVAAKAPQESVAEFSMLGRLPMWPRVSISQKDAIALHELSSRSVLGSLQYWLTDLLTEPSPDDGTVRTAQILALAENNPLLLSELSLAASQTSSAAILKQCEGGPKNVALATAEANIYPAEQSIMLSEKMIRLSPKNPQGWSSLAQRYMNYAGQIRNGRNAGEIAEGEWKRFQPLYALSLAAAQQAESLYPESEDILRQVAVAATFSGDSATAEAAMEKIFTLSKQRGITPPAASWALQMYHPKWSGSLEKFEKMSARLSELPAHNLRDSVSIMESIGRWFPSQSAKMAKRIEAEARKGIQTGTDFTAGEALYKALSYQGKTKEATEAARQWVALHPNDAEAQMLVVYEYVDKKQIDKAIDALQRIVKAKPYEAKYQMKLAELYIEQKRYQDAAEPGAAAAKSMSNSFEAQSTAGYALAMLGKWRDALPFLERAMAIRPEDNYAMYNLGEALCHLNHVPRGRKLLKKVRASNNIELSKEAAKLLKQFPE